eukprot:SAG31_NODE_273_length_18667_cov_3.603619_13_plen_52_part_00
MYPPGARRGRGKLCRHRSSVIAAIADIAAAAAAGGGKRCVCGLAAQFNFKK